MIGVQREGLHLLQKRVLKLYEFVIVAWYVSNLMLVIIEAITLLTMVESLHFH